MFTGSNKAYPGVYGGYRKHPDNKLGIILVFHVKTSHGRPMAIF